MMGVARQFGDVVRFACEQGYRMFGEAELLCDHAGSWNYAPPSCHREYRVSASATEAPWPPSIHPLVESPTRVLTPVTSRRADTLPRASHRRRRTFWAPWLPRSGGWPERVALLLV